MSWDTARLLEEYEPGLIIEVNDLMQNDYSYELAEYPGEELEFDPFYTPQEMLALGVFEGKYLNDCFDEFPAEWHSPQMNVIADPRLNYFGVKSRQSRSVWLAKGWIPCVPGDPDVRGWFQWYCRYWLGRRLPEVDDHQIKRWRAFKRHSGQVRLHGNQDVTVRVKQRQALLQWSHDPFPDFS